jgi:HEPN domain-containing protein
MTRGRARTRPVSKSETRQFIGKAEEFLETATAALAVSRFNAAAGNAIHAGINAVDAILGSRSGERASGQDHGQAVALVRAVPKVGKDAANLLGRLLPLKTKAEYDPAPVSATDAGQAVEQATRLVEIARSVVGDDPTGVESA